MSEQPEDYRFSFDYWGEGHVHSNGTITLRDTVNSSIMFYPRDLPKLKLLAAVQEGIRRDAERRTYHVVHEPEDLVP